MKANRFNQLLSQRQIPVGHMIFEFGTRGMAKILEQCNLDFVVLDTEHAAFSVDQIADLMAWFKATPIAPFVRIPQIEYHLIARALDNGALGIMVPNVKTAAEARKVVECVKYAPEGNRGCIFGDAHTDFQNVQPAEFMAHSNANTTVLSQIESGDGLENLEEIAATDGVDVLWIGQFDLTQSLGIPGQFQHTKFLTAIKRVVQVAQRRKLAVAMQPDSLAQARHWLDLGINVLSYSGDFFVYQRALNQAVKDIRSLTKAKIREQSNEDSNH